jgi:hypothetical protein
MRFHHRRGRHLPQHPGLTDPAPPTSIVIMTALSDRVIVDAEGSLDATRWLP